MEENTSFWSKTNEDLTVSDQFKVIAIAPIISVVAIVVPLCVIGKIMEVHESRKLKKKAKLVLVVPDEVTE